MIETYKNRHIPIASNGNINIYAVLFGMNNKVVYSIDNGKKHYVRIYKNTRGFYFKHENSKIYLSDCNINDIY